ncbi:TPA: transcriptional regulator, partial [Escherichia coli]|nr:transcriptional regulator [Escherichia coli]
MQLVAICMQPMTLIRKTWEKIATEILSLNVICQRRMKSDPLISPPTA